jgi:hypothetical protein
VPAKDARLEDWKPRTRRRTSSGRAVSHRERRHRSDPFVSCRSMLLASWDGAEQRSGALVIGEGLSQGWGLALPAGKDPRADSDGGGGDRRCRPDQGALCKYTLGYFTKGPPIRIAIQIGGFSKNNLSGFYKNTPNSDHPPLSVRSTRSLRPHSFSAAA